MFNKQKSKNSKETKKSQKFSKKTQKKTKKLKQSQNISNLMIAWKNKAAKPKNEPVGNDDEPHGRHDDESKFSFNILYVYFLENI